MISNVTFRDGIEANRQYPDTFEIPDRETLNTLTPGDVVKVCAENEQDQGERFWIILTHIGGIEDNSTLKGKVANYLVFADEFGFNFGDEIEFERRHILSIFS